MRRTAARGTASRITKSIRRDFLEECYEAIEAIDTEDPVLLREELGDVLFHVAFHSELEREAGRFDLDDVISDVAPKWCSVTRMCLPM